MRVGIGELRWMFGESPDGWAEMDVWMRVRMGELRWMFG